MAALARYHRNQGRHVRVFKTGPDFIDPMIHEQASGNPVYQLDLWMVGESQSKQLLFEAALEADLILIEGVMGLYDGEPSSADLAVCFGVPVAAVIDASAMAQTFGAIASGLASYRPEMEFAGVIANRVASEGHGEMLQQSIASQSHWLGSLPRAEDITLPERHLGLYQAADIDDLDKKLDAAAELIGLTPMARLPKPVSFTLFREQVVSPLLQGQRIAVAKDPAFSFVYRANLDLLTAMGAEITFFSPLEDNALPVADSVYLPGGYPELYLSQLSANQEMKLAINEHCQSGKPMVAECGGMLYLLETLTDKMGNSGDMAGVIPASASIQKRLAGLGAQAADLGSGELRGHTFHYSSFDKAPSFELYATRHPRGTEGEGVLKNDGLVASYVHWYFPSNPQAAADLFLQNDAQPKSGQ